MKDFEHLNFSGLVERVLKITDEGTYFTITNRDGSDRGDHKKSFPARLDPSVITGAVVKAEVQARESTSLPLSFLIYYLTIMSGPYEGLQYEHRLK
ncbi:hypothetical protein HYU22_04775 [Candidatus Woesearchaeota archaeon]|nr:hypothetical protein [Candidatus Woesearchaeota archaeon]